MPQTPNQWLDYNGPAPVDTTESTTGAKWAQYSPAGVVSKQNTLLIIPAFSDTVPPTSGNGLLGFFARNFRQFNYTAQAPFSILDIYTAANQLVFKNNWLNCVPSIRFRVGNKMTRYIINTFQYSSALANGLIFPIAYPLYAGQTIQPQFCIELWTIATGFNVGITFPLTCSNSTTLTLNTSMLNVADPIDSIPGNLSPLVNMGLNDMSVLLPQPFGTPNTIAFNPSIQWNSN